MRSELERLCDRLGIKCEATYGNQAPPEGMEDMTPWRVTLKCERRQLTTDFYTGSAWEREPNAADVLACLVSDATAADQDFESWASDLGYDTDSRKAEKIYNACRAIAPKVRRLLGSHFDAIARAEH